VPIAFEAGRTFHVVLTLRHHMGVRWLDLANTERVIWRKQQQTKLWRTGVEGFFRANEVTFGENGFHHHIHAGITLSRDVDPEEFKVWLEKYWKDQAAALGRSTDWKEGWWSEIKTEEELAHVVRYGTKTGAFQHVVASEILGDSAKSSAPWHLPVEAYCEVWHASRGHRWFGVGGCWRPDDDDDDDGASELEADVCVEREQAGVLVARIPANVWIDLNYGQKSWLLGVAHNRIHSSRQIADAWGRVVQAHIPTPAG
jgi:hypothetical protein